VKTISCTAAVVLAQFTLSTFAAADENRAAAIAMPARNALKAELIADQKQAIGWGVSPTFQLTLTNGDLQEWTDLEATFRIVDLASGVEVAEEKMPVGTLKGGANVTLPFRPELKAGVYEVRWEIADASGSFPKGKGSLRAARMLADASRVPKGEKERSYVRHWSLLGGIFWKATHDLERVAKTGGTWERFGNTCQWKTLERKPGVIDVSPAVAEVQRLHDAGMDLIFFNTVYNQPSFHRIGQQGFAAAYGRLHATEAEAFGDRVGVYELGNEDNGPTKFLYTEIARHGAAGVRSKNAEALIGNAGTAQVDIGWLRMQAGRGLLDRLDAIITHPYSWSSSPESYGVLTQLEQVNEVIDDLGGMKTQLTTEWGYSHTFDQRKRAEWGPRHMAIAAAVGLYRHGLYSFDNHFGIYDNGRPFPMAATLNAHVVLTTGYRFAGWLERSETAWVAVYEKAGKPLLMAWSPAEKGEFKLPAVNKMNGFEVLDMYGNAQGPSTGSGGVLELSGAPVYILGLAGDVVRLAYQEALERAQRRYQRLLSNSPLNESTVWRDLSKGNPGGKAEALRKALLNWNSREVTSAEQAVVAQALRWLSTAVHAEAALLPGAPADGTLQGQRYEQWVQRLRESVANDIDQPSLRWVLLQWRQLRDEQEMLREWGESGKASHLAKLEDVYDKVCGEIDSGGSKIFFPLWGFAHSSPGAVEATMEPLSERFQFIPGRAVPVKVRVHSYSAKAYKTTVSLELPAGWVSDPQEWTGETGAGGSQEILFQVTAGDGSPKRFATLLSVPGKPPVRVPFDDFEILPPLEVTVPVLSGALPEDALPLRLSNHGKDSVDAVLRILEGSGLPSLARMEIGGLKPGETREVAVRLSPTLKAPAFHAWNLIAEVEAGKGRRFQTPLTIDHELAMRTSSAPLLDGQLTRWEKALPLHLEKEEYARGSFGTTWSPEDLSGVIYTMWDDANFYIAARVKDQLFNQELERGDAWNQDSLQFILASERGLLNPFILALTPRGPQVWNERTRRLADARLKVQLNQGETIYEAAIPWSEFDGIKPTAGQKLRFDVLLNDDDAIINRRFMERYGIGIVHDRKKEKLGWLELGHNLRETSAAGEEAGAAGDVRSRGPAPVFLEDFEEYASGQIPDRWVATSHLSPVPRTVVRDDLGRHDSRCLELDNQTGRVSHIFLSMTRPLSGLEAGRRYRLAAWVKGGVGGEMAHLIGICSDRFGNEGHSYISAWEPSGDWQEVSMEFTAPGGNLNIIVCNSRELSGLLIDEISVREIAP